MTAGDDVPILKVEPIPVHSPWTSARGCAVLGVAVGLLAGLTESVTCAIQHYGHLGSLIFARPHYEWMPSVAYSVLLGATGWLAGLLLRLLPTPARRVLVGAVLVIFASAVFYLAVSGADSILRLGLHRYARVVLAVGLAAAAARRLARHSQRAWRVVRVGIPAAALIVATWTGVIQFQEWRRERQLLAEMGPVPEGKPNVLLIVWDTVRAKNLSLYGYGRPTTPTLERLSQSAIVFDHAIATAPWTLPSHVGMFTGLYQHDLPQLERTGLPHGVPTLAEALSREGYATGGFAANRFYCHRRTGLASGFQHYEDIPVTLGSVLLSSRLNAAFWTWLRICLAGSGFLKEGIRKPAEQVNADFLRWRDRNCRRPFFAFLNYFDAHEPYFPPSPFDENYGPHGPTEHQVIASYRCMAHAESVTRAELQVAVRAYDGCIAYLDQQLSVLLEALENRDDLRNTLVIITSDHGEEFGEHGVLGHATNLYECQTHVPLLALLPGGTGPSRHVPQTTSLGDLAATVLDVVGAQGLTFPGRSWRPYWQPPPLPTSAVETVSVRAELDKAIYLPVPTDGPNATGDLLGVWLDRTKYLRRVGNDSTEELYDLASDPDELRDLTARPDSRNTLDRCRREARRLEATATSSK